MQSTARRGTKVLGWIRSLLVAVILSTTICASPGGAFALLSPLNLLSSPGVVLERRTKPRRHTPASGCFLHPHHRIEPSLPQRGGGSQLRYGPSDGKDEDVFFIDDDDALFDHDEIDDEEQAVEEERILEVDGDIFPLPQPSDGNATTTTDYSLKHPLTLDQLSEAFTKNVSYFYLQNELGLSDQAMWRITFEASSALGMSTAVIRHKVEVLRETMNLSEQDVRTIIERFPAILHLSADKNIAPTMLYLLRALDLGREDLRELVIAFPAVLSYSRTNLMSKIGFFTRLMKYSVTECRELVLGEPRLLRAGVKTGLVPRMKFLLSDVQIPMNELKVIVQKNPLILLYSLEQNLAPKLVFYMLMQLQMSARQVTKLLLAYPQVLNYNLDRTIQPMTEYFVHDLEFSNTEFAAILLRFPRLFTLSLRKIKHAVGYYRFELGLSPFQVKGVLYRAPGLLGLNADTNVRNKVKYLQSTLGLTDDQTRTLVAAMPSILGLSIPNNLQPKLDYLLASLGNNGSILRDTVLRLPTLLGYSLKNRIQPRVEAILEAGLDASCITIGIPMKHVDFESWLQRRKDTAIRRKRQEEPPPVSPPMNDKSDDSSDASGRIVHWSRERRPRPDV